MNMISSAAYIAELTKGIASYVIRFHSNFLSFPEIVFKKSRNFLLKNAYFLER